MYVNGVPPVSLLPLPSVAIPSVQDIVSGTWLLVLPQIPLTIANAILATSLLLQDLYRVQVKPDRLSKTIGLMTTGRTGAVVNDTRRPATDTTV